MTNGFPPYRLVAAIVSLLCLFAAYLCLATQVGKADITKIRLAASIMCAASISAAAWALWYHRLDRAFGYWIDAMIPGYPDTRKHRSAGYFENVLASLFVVAFAVTVVAVNARESTVLKIFAAEDGPFENATVVFYLSAAVFSAISAFRFRSSRWICFHLSCLGVLFFVVGMEEMSWGQRIIGYNTPEVLSMANRQGEFNIHNVYSTSLTQYCALLVVSTLLLFLPVLEHTSPKMRRVFSAICYPVAPLRYAFLYLLVVGLWIWLGLRWQTVGFLPDQGGSVAPNTDDEFYEFFVGALFFILAITSWGIDQHSPDRAKQT